MSKFEKALLSFAEEKNAFRQRGFSADLSASQVKATVKSVCTWTKYTGSGRIRGVMRLSNQEHLTQREKQRKSAQRTAEVRKAKTAVKVKQAVQSLIENGLTPSLVSIAKIVGISRQTVSRYKQVIEKHCVPKTSLICLEEVFCNVVKFGAHQMSGVEGCIKRIGDTCHCIPDYGVMFIKKIHYSTIFLENNDSKRILENRCSD